ncbi:MAG: hypothetical protein WBV69_23525 [Candidatus Sulfotelmatobacter sp.]
MTILASDHTRTLGQIARTLSHDDRLMTIEKTIGSIKRYLQPTTLMAATVGGANITYVHKISRSLSLLAGLDYECEAHGATILITTISTIPPRQAIAGRS